MDVDHQRARIAEILEDLAIPRCPAWRAENQMMLCPSVHCARCQTIRELAGVDVLEPYIGGIDG